MSSAGLQLSCKVVFVKPNFCLGRLVSLLKILRLCHVVFQVSELATVFAQVSLANIVLAQLLVLVLKVFICAVRLNFVKKPRLRVSLVDCRHLDAAVIDVRPPDLLEKVTRLHFLNGESLLAAWLNQATDQSLCCFRDLLAWLRRRLRPFHRHVGYFAVSKVNWSSS